MEKIIHELDSVIPEVGMIVRINRNHLFDPRPKSVNYIADDYMVNSDMDSFNTRSVTESGNTTNWKNQSSWGGQKLQNWLKKGVSV